MLTKPLLIWHTFRARYHEILIQDCLDDTLKKTLTQKLNYHKQKLHELYNPHAP